LGVWEDSTGEIEEERRLLYVAMTRAKDQLDLITPQRFFVHHQQRGGDRHMFASRSRFITSGIAKLFEQCAWPHRPAGRRDGPAAEAHPVIDIKARVSGMWKVAG